MKSVHWPGLSSIQKDDFCQSESSTSDIKHLLVMKGYILKLQQYVTENNEAFLEAHFFHTQSLITPWHTTLASHITTVSLYHCIILVRVVLNHCITVSLYHASSSCGDRISPYQPLRHTCFCGQASRTSWPADQPECNLKWIWSLAFRMTISQLKR